MCSMCERVYNVETEVESNNQRTQGSLVSLVFARDITELKVTMHP